VTAGCENNHNENLNKLEVDIKKQVQNLMNGTCINEHLVIQNDVLINEERSDLSTEFEYSIDEY